jgi:hypothetical protein
MSERLPFSLSHWGVFPRLALALAAVLLIWLAIWVLL